MNNEFMKVCTKAEKDKRLNPDRRQFQCDDFQLFSTNSDIKWTTKWYKDSIKNGFIDWDKYHKYYKEKKRSKKRSGKMSKRQKSKKSKKSKKSRKSRKSRK